MAATNMAFHFQLHHSIRKLTDNLSLTWSTCGSMRRTVVVDQVRQKETCGNLWLAGQGTG